jgi:hypothetical protein
LVFTAADLTVYSEAERIPQSENSSYRKT